MVCGCTGYSGRNISVIGLHTDCFLLRKQKFLRRKCRRWLGLLPDTFSPIYPDGLCTDGCYWLLSIIDYFSGGTDSIDHNMTLSLVPDVFGNYFAGTTNVIRYDDSCTVSLFSA